MQLEEAIRQRRTHKFYGGGAVSEQTLRELLELAIWAPNHGLTEPWRFTVVPKSRFDDMLAAVERAFEQMRKGDDEDAAMRLAFKKRKMARRLAGAGAVIAVSYRRTPDRPVVDREDYAATACAVQNILLGATARDLVGLWSTGKVMSHAEVREFFQQPEDEGQVGVIFLGTAVQEVPPRRSHDAASLSRWL